MASLFTNSRKAQQTFTIGSLGQIAIALLVVAVIIGLSSTILEKFTKIADDNSAQTGNVSLTWVANNTAIEIGQQQRFTGAGTVFNGSLGTIDNSLWEIIVVNNSIVFHNTTAQIWNTDNLTLDATYLIGSSSRNISKFGVTGLITMAEFIPTIAIVAVAAIVIGIVLVFFGRKREDEVR